MTLSQNIPGYLNATAVPTFDFIMQNVFEYCLQISPGRGEKKSKTEKDISLRNTYLENKFLEVNKQILFLRAMLN